jgi:hypothetical protein
MISEELLPYIGDGDLHTKLDNIEYSTSLREVVTVEYMLKHPQD